MLGSWYYLFQYHSCHRRKGVQVVGEVRGSIKGLVHRCTDLLQGAKFLLHNRSCCRNDYRYLLLNNVGVQNDLQGARTPLRGFCVWDGAAFPLEKIIRVDDLANLDNLSRARCRPARYAIREDSLERCLKARSRSWDFAQISDELSRCRAKGKHPQFGPRLRPRSLATEIRLFSLNATMTFSLVG